MVPELLEPPRDVYVGLVLCDVVNEEGADCPSVVCRGDGSVSLLTSSVPNLRLYGLAIDRDGACRKLNPDGRLGLEVELVPREAREKVGLSDARVTDEDDLEEVIVV